MERHSNHILEEDSNRALENLLPKQWVARKLRPDYGLDYLIEVFTIEKPHIATGKIFFAQLKATEQISKNDTIKLRIERKHIEYFSKHSSKVILFLYSKPENKFWFKVANGFAQDFNLKESTNKSFTIVFNKGDIATEESIDSIPNILNYENQFYLDIKAESKSADKIAKQIEAHINIKVGSIFKDTPLNTKRIEITINNKSENVYSIISKITDDDYSYSFELPDPSILEYLPNNNLILVEYLAPLVQHICMHSYKSDLKGTLDLYIASLNQDYKYKLGREFYALITETFSSSLFEDIDEMLDHFLQTDDLNGIECIEFGLYFSVFKTDSKLHGEKYRYFLNKILEHSEGIKKGILYYNIANNYHATGLDMMAIKHYNLARKHEPEYKKRFYWWEELGSSLYNLQRYRISCECYKCAIECGSDANRDFITFAFLGDTYFHQKKFEKAINEYDKYLESSKNIRHLYLIKRYASIKLQSIKFDFSKEWNLLDEKHFQQLSISEKIDYLEFRLSKSILDANNWTRLGDLYNVQENFKSSVICYLIATSINENISKILESTFWSAFNTQDQEYSILLQSTFLAGTQIYKQEFYRSLISDIYNNKDINSSSKTFLIGIIDEIRSVSNDILRDQQSTN